MRIGIIGVGKVGSAFLTACQATAALQIVGVQAGRTAAAAAQVQQHYDVPVCATGAEVLLAADVLLLTVPDSQIAAVAQTLANELPTLAASEPLAQKVCLHCSGSLDLEALAPLAALGVHCGSLHPLQSFTASGAEFNGIGMAVDGDAAAQRAATTIAVALAARPFHVPASERRAYHAAACFCSNYLVTVTAIAQQLMARWTDDEAAALQILLPLLDGTVKNLHQVQQARAALTGPIARGDSGTVAGHLAVLPEYLQQAYRELGLQTVPLAYANGSIDAAAAKTLQGLLKGQAAKEQNNG